jgi:plasmid stabilization system protein ParE
MAFHVKLSTEADRDLDAILSWLIEQCAGETGLRWWWGLQDAVYSLAKFPERCPLTPENKSFPFEVRHLLYGNRPDI